MLARRAHDARARTPAEKRGRGAALVVSLRAVLANLDEGFLSAPTIEIDRMRAQLAERTR